MPGTMKDFGFAQWARSVRPGVDIVLAGTPERAAHAAGELCEQGPHLMKPLRAQGGAGPYQRVACRSGEPRELIDAHSRSQTMQMC